ncbi:MAG TPA: peptidylprolyl isomerase [Rhodanobacteraceae bacterium]|jgi:FKBP-type peptidyl-prolyl cis-trans isomerase SlyD|nr:peptidylprolyl isomerase [Rhodanobacteraceae bacterium]
MPAEKDSVVSFHYSVRDAADAAAEPFDDSRKRGEPMWALLGHGQLVPGVEKALAGREAGEKFEVDITPADAYGDYQEDLLQRVPKKYFQEGQRLKPGDTAVLQTRDGGQRRVTVRKVGMTTIDVDHNHPLAGKALHFDIEVIAVRAAAPEELAHGHAHPGDGHVHG